MYDHNETEQFIEPQQSAFELTQNVLSRLLGWLLKQAPQIVWASNLNDRFPKRKHWLKFLKNVNKHNFGSETDYRATRVLICQWNRFIFKLKSSLGFTYLFLWWFYAGVRICLEFSIAIVLSGRYHCRYIWASHEINWKTFVVFFELVLIGLIASISISRSVKPYWSILALKSVIKR